MAISIARFEADNKSFADQKKAERLGFRSSLARTPRISRSFPRRPTNHFYEETKHDKIMGIDECMESRPPIRIDLSGPTPCTYSLPDKTPIRRSLPAYSIGQRPTCKEGGGRRAWTTEFFANENVWTRKCDFEDAVCCTFQSLWPEVSRLYCSSPGC
eukprot:m.182223 g.182223  ORF g.182223 m.182223 type:complete len:157 (+) comp39289_c2_seq3:926-1396(+)